MTLTLEEAIKHCEEVAERQETNANSFENGDDFDKSLVENCLECAEEYRQLSEWLKELKTYRNAITEMKKWINSNNRGNADYFIVDKIEGIIEEVYADEDSD